MAAKVKPKTEPIAPSVATPAADNSGVETDRLMDTEFVMLDTLRCKDLMATEKGPIYRIQMCTFLEVQEKRCSHYKKYFEDQNNLPMSTLFAAHAAATQKFLKLLDDDPNHLPASSFEIIKFSAVPFNPDVKERVVELNIKTYDLPEEATNVLVVAEFEYPNQVETSLKTGLLRWYKQIMIEPKNLYYSMKGESRQYDAALIEELIQFQAVKSDATGTNRPLIFFVEKGKSRTHKRKFKPIKLFFYQRTRRLCSKELLGTALVRIDQINDEATFKLRVPIAKGRQKIGLAEVRVRVREPLVNKTPRPLEEKILCFT